MYKQIRINFEASRRFAGSGAITIVFLLGAMSAVEAAEWRFEPVLRLAADFDDNPYLSIRTDVEKNVSGYIAEGSAKIAYASDKTDFFITPTLRGLDYGKDSELNSDDYFLATSWGHNTESTNFRIRGRYANESVRTAERADADLDVEDPDEIPDDDTGVVSIIGRRESVRVTPSFSYRVTDASSIGLDLNYSDVSYEDVFAGLLTDYTDSRLNASFRRAWSPTSTAILTGTYRNYQTDRGENEVKGVGLVTGVNYRVSETARFRATAGLENTEVGDNDNDMNWVADVSFVRRQKTTTLLAQYRRSISASGSGSLATRDSISLNFTRDLSDRISAGLGARIYSTNAIDETIAPFEERDYVQLRARFTWYLSRTISMEADYRYTFLARENLEESANSNQITIWMNYVPVPMTSSR